VLWRGGGSQCIAAGSRIGLARMRWSVGSAWGYGDGHVSTTGVSYKGASCSAGGTCRLHSCDFRALPVQERWRDAARDTRSCHIVRTKVEAATR